MTTDADKFSRATGRSFAGWREVLDKESAGDLPHKALAARALELMPSDMTGNREWWAQCVAIEYGREAGTRAVGQGCGGDFAVSTTKTVRVGIDEALAKWTEAIDAHLAENAASVDGVTLSGEPRTSSSEKWRYWRVDLVDGTKVTVSVTASGGSAEKSIVSVSHEKLAELADRDRWKPVWKSVLSRMT